MSGRVESRAQGRLTSRLGHWLQNALFVALVLMLAGLAGWLGERHALRFDWTADRAHTLAEPSLRALAEFSGPIELTAFVRPGGPLVDRVDALLERYLRAYPELRVERLNPDLAPARVRELGIGAEGELVLAYAGRREIVRELNEQAVTNALLALARDEIRHVRLLAGHGERRMSGEANHDLGRFGEELTRTGLKLESYSAAISGAVPDPTALLVIAGPRSALLPGELAQLEAYIDRGGNLLWLDDPDLVAILEPLADRLGVRFIPGVAVDAVGQAYGIGDPSFAVIAQYPLHPVTEGLAVVTVFPQARALELVPDSGWNGVPLLQTLARSWVESGPVDGTISQDGDERRGPLLLGLALTRPRAGGGEQRVAVIGDGDFLANTYLGNGGNLEFGLRLVNWLVADDDLVTIPPRAAPDRNLALSQLEIAIIAFGFLVVAPLSLLGLGFGTWWHRHHR